MDRMFERLEQIFALDPHRCDTLRDYLATRRSVAKGVNTLVNALHIEWTSLGATAAMIDETGRPVITLQVRDAILGRARGASVKQYAHWISVIARCLDFADPVDDDDVRRRIRSARAEAGDPTSAVAITPTRLPGRLCIDDLLDVAIDLCERAWLLLARDLAQRGTVSANIVAADAGLDPRGRPQLRIAFTKSTSAPDHLPLGVDTIAALDAARAACGWKPLCWDATGFQPAGTLLPPVVRGTIGQGPMTALRLTSLIKSLVIRAGSDAGGYSLHSLRVGRAEAAIADNAEDQELLRAGLWRQVGQALRYGRHLPIWAKAPAALLIREPVPKAIGDVLLTLRMRNEPLLEKGRYRMKQRDRSPGIADAGVRS